MKKYSSFISNSKLKRHKEDGLCGIRIEEDGITATDSFKLIHVPKKSLLFPSIPDGLTNSNVCLPENQKWPEDLAEISQSGLKNKKGIITPAEIVQDGNFPAWRNLRINKEGDPGTVTITVNAKFLAEIAMFFVANTQKNKVPNIKITLSANGRPITFTDQDGLLAEVLLMPVIKQ